MPAHPVNLTPRISASIAVMQPSTENDCECAPVKAHSSLLAPSCVDTDGAPARAPFGVWLSTVVQRLTDGGVGCQRDWSKAKSKAVSPKAADFVTSSSSLVAPIQTPNTWPTFVQAGNADSYRSAHGAIRKTAPIAILIGCLSLSDRTSAIAGLCRSTSMAIPTWRAIARSHRTPRVRRLCSIDLNRTARRHVPTTNATRKGVAA